MKRLLLLGGCVLLSMAITMCDNPSQTKSGLTKKQKLKIYYENKYAEIKADSVADVIIPLKKELENKLDNQVPKIEEIRKQYLAEYDKWHAKKNEFMNLYNSEILKKYDISDDVYDKVCKDMAQEDVKNMPSKEDLISFINEH